MSKERNGVTAEENAAAATPASRKAPPSAVNARRPAAWIERLEMAALRVALAALWPLSPLNRARVAAALGRALGPWMWFAWRAEDNLKRVMPALDARGRRRVVAQMSGNFARTGVEYAQLPALAARAARFSVTGLDHLAEARRAADGRLIVVSAHYGNWEAVRAVAALQGAPLAIIYRAFNNKRIDDKFYSYIVSAGWPAFRKGRIGARQLFAHVRGGGGALILVDQRLGGAPVLDFMGRPAETSLAAAQLARTLKAPLLPAVAARRGDGFDVRFEPPIASGSPIEMSQAINDRITEWVTTEPGQWFWLHRRWRVRDADRKRDYARGEDGRGEGARGEDGPGGAD